MTPMFRIAGWHDGTIAYLQLNWRKSLNALPAARYEKLSCVIIKHEFVFIQFFQIHYAKFKAFAGPT